MRLMSFNLFTFPISDSIAMRQGETSEDGSFVSLDAADEAAPVLGYDCLVLIGANLNQFIHNVGRRTRLISNPVNYCIFELASQGSRASQMYSVHPDLI